MPQSGKTFRVFISSTFADLKKERNALQERVFPRIRQLCTEHGARFQAIDLRWGVSEEAGADQQTLSICLEEVRRCRRVTPRPNFVVLLGQRYGWRPLPPQIPADEFEAVLDHVPTADLALVAWDAHQPEGQKGWYRRDDNAVPAEYVLQPRTGEYTIRTRWTPVEAHLRSVLYEAARKGGLSASAMVKFERSATELEILEGALQAGEDHAFCYLRAIDNLPRDEHAHKFLDLDGEDKPDADSERLLSDLEERLQQHLPASNVYSYDAQWSPENDITDFHLDMLCARVEADLARVILAELDTKATTVAGQPDLDSEIESHQEFGQERANNFRGRTETLHAINDYLSDIDPHPLVVYGPAGSGKSALVARAVQRAQDAHPEAALVYRFLGATPSSSDIRSLLESLCQEIDREYGSVEPVPGEYRELVSEIPKRLALATPQKPLLLFLDALDQLSATDNAQSLNWLPRELPTNVRLVTTALEREGPGGECLQRARARLPESSFITLPPLTDSQGAEILDLWLAEAKRTLTQEQRGEVLAKFATSPYPLYLRVAFLEAVRWRSYDPMANLATGTERVLTSMLTRLENPANHGHMLVSRVLGYLAAARNGLTEDELLDVLWSDKEVQTDFYSRHPRSDQLDRLPVVIWSRLFFDLEPYLTERRADETSLFSFYHREFCEVVTRRHLADEPGLALHIVLAHYFAEGRTLTHRRAREWPWQLLQAHRHDDLCELLCKTHVLHGLVVMAYDDVLNYWRTISESRDMVEAYSDAWAMATGAENSVPAQDVTAFADDIGMVLEDCGHWPAAAIYYNRHLERITIERSSEGLSVQLARRKYAACLSRMRMYREAEPILRRALDESVKLLGPRSAVAADTATDLAVTLRHQGSIDEAQNLHKWALEASLFGVMEAQAPALHAVAFSAFLRETGRPHEALDIANKAVDTLHSTVGPAATASLLAQLEVAEVRYALGEHSTAQAVASEITRQLVNTLGANHPHAQRASSIVGEWRKLNAAKGVESKGASIERSDPR